MTTFSPAQPMVTRSPAILQRARAAVRPALEAALQSMQPDLAGMGRYAMGGKGIRPAMAILSAEAGGGKADDALPGALAVELAHVFSLVHDDIIDGDEARRNRPASWKAFGLGAAVLSGDSLLALAYETLATACMGAANSLFAHSIVSLIRGQADDLAFETRPWTGADSVSLDEYRRMAGDKTGALMQCAAAVGAALTGARPATVKALGLAGLHLGLAFQAVDDLLGIWGDPAVTGKPASSDLGRGKKTFPILAAVNSGTKEGDLLVKHLNRGLSYQADVEIAAQLMLDAGGSQAAQDEADTQLRRALAELDQVEMDDSVRAEFTELAHHLVARHS